MFRSQLCQAVVTCAARHLSPFRLSGEIDPPMEAMTEQDEKAERESKQQVQPDVLHEGAVKRHDGHKTRP